MTIEIPEIKIKHQPSIIEKVGYGDRLVYCSSSELLRSYLTYSSFFQIIERRKKNLLIRDIYGIDQTITFEKLVNDNYWSLFLVLSPYREKVGLPTLDRNN